MSSITLRCPEEEQAQEESDFASSPDILWLCAHPGRVKTLKSDSQSQIVQRVFLQFFIPRKPSCFVWFCALKCCSWGSPVLRSPYVGCKWESQQDSRGLGFPLMNKYSIWSSGRCSSSEEKIGKTVPFTPGSELSRSHQGGSPDGSLNKLRSIWMCRAYALSEPWDNFYLIVF